jgi:hypothetical protein
MLERLRSEQTGSLSAVTVALLAVVILIAMGAAELGFRTYALQSLQETADVAAEAGGRFRETYARITITRYHLYEVERQVCDEVDAAGRPICHTETEIRRTWSYPVIEGRQSDLETNWRALFGCGDAWDDWACVGKPAVLTPERANRWIEFTSVEREAETNFRNNWPDRQAASITNVTATAISADRAVTVLVRVHFRPLFLAFLGDRDVWIKGRSNAALPPLAFH